MLFPLHPDNDEGKQFSILGRFEFNKLYVLLDPSKTFRGKNFYQVNFWTHIFLRFAVVWREKIEASHTFSISWIVLVYFVQYFDRCQHAAS